MPTKKKYVRYVVRMSLRMDDHRIHYVIRYYQREDYALRLVERLRTQDAPDGTKYWYETTETTAPYRPNPL